MNRPTERLLRTSRIAADLVMVSIGWILAYYLRFYTSIEVTAGIPPEGLYFKLIPFIAMIWLAVFYVAGFYHRTGKHRSAFTEGLDIIQCCALATLAFIAFTYFYEEYRYSRITLAIFALLHPWLVMAGRSAIRKFVRRYRKRAPKRNVLVIGGGDSLRHALLLSTSIGVEPSQIIGVILVGSDETRAEDEAYCRERGLALMEPPRSDWASFFAETPTQSVVFALPHGAYRYLEENLDKIADQVPDIKLIPDILRYTRFSAGIEMIRGIPVISVHESPLAGMGSLIKRLVDIAGAAVAILIFSPVMALIALLVPLTSRGPILYRQERMGLDGRTFQCLKFRSMPIDAEARTGAVWATAGDNRATWFGSFLRRTSLDELPQLFNVLFGDMSLVGPRPERPVFVNQFRKEIPGYMLRHKVKAGMTGWAQVNGWRGNTSLEKRIECDLFYIQNWSIWLDFKIMIMTIEEVFFGRNAY